MSAHVSTRLRLSAHAICRVSAVLVCSRISLSFSRFLRRFTLSRFPFLPRLSCSLARSHTQPRYPLSPSTLPFASAPSNHVCNRRLSCAQVHLCIASTQAHKRTSTHTHIDTHTHAGFMCTYAYVHMHTVSTHARTHTRTHMNTQTAMMRPDARGLDSGTHQ